MKGVVVLAAVIALFSLSALAAVAEPCNDVGQFCVHSSTGLCPGGIFDEFDVIPFPDGDQWCVDQTGNSNFICCQKTACDAGTCGDGNIDLGEDCDDGADLNGPYGTCSDQCTINFCGDGIIQQPNGDGQTEWCDDGGVCSGDTDIACQDHSTCELGGWGTCIPQAGDGCNAQCQPEVCGNDVLEPNGIDGIPGTADDEQCDGTDMGACGTSCTPLCKCVCDPTAETWTDAPTCEDGLDNDCDGLIDYDDPDCYCQDQDSDGFTCQYESPGVCLA